RVFLLWAVTRNIFGSVRVNVESRFLEDIPDELRENAEEGKKRWEMKFEEKNKKGKNKLNKERKSFFDGQRVRHNAFGEGVVISIKDDIITIAFMKAGLKKLSAEFAGLDKV
ncbi:MAG: hypothetical protein V1814_03210, partial [Candidatus Moraniibacteriota bacterium]